MVKMLLQRVAVLLLLVGGLRSPSNLNAVDHFWLTYPSPHGGDHLMLARMDALGNITGDPIVLAAPRSFDAWDLEIFFDSQKRLNIWVRPSLYHRLVFYRSDLRPPLARPRANILLKFTKVSWTSPYVTQRPNNNFLTLNVPSPPGSPSYYETPTGYRISDANAALTSGPWPLFEGIPLPAADFNIGHGGVISEDGLVGYFWGGVVGGGEHGLYLARLDADGRARGAPLKLETFPSDSIQATNTLPDGKRRLVYVRNLGPSEHVPDLIYSRTIDSAVTSVSPRIRVSPAHRMYIGLVKSLVIDRRGRFIVYGAAGPVDDNNCGIFYQALDPSTGKRVGVERRIIPDTCGPITMVKDPG